MKGSRREEVEVRTVCTGVRENVRTFRTLKADGPWTVSTRQTKSGFTGAKYTETSEKQTNGRKWTVDRLARRLWAKGLQDLDASFRCLAVNFLLSLNCIAVENGCSFSTSNRCIKRLT